MSFFDNADWFTSSDWAPVEDYSSPFSNTDWFTSDSWAPSDDYSSVFADPNWFGNTDWVSDYDPLSDYYASTGDITTYIDDMLSNPDLYSMVGGDEYGLGIGDSLLSLSEPNVLGELLSENPSTGAGSSNFLSNLLKQLGGTANRATNDPMSALMAIGKMLATRKSVDLTKKANSSARNIAQGQSQRGLGSNRTGLVNMNTAPQAPGTLVAPAPLITRQG